MIPEWDLDEQTNLYERGVNVISEEKIVEMAWKYICGKEEAQASSPADEDKREG